jgi:hypothetical protein
MSSAVLYSGVKMLILIAGNVITNKSKEKRQNIKKQPSGIHAN